MLIYRYQAKITAAKDGFSVEFPDLPGCLSCGKTLAEAQVMAREALELYLEDYKDGKNKLPEAVSRVGECYHWIEVRI